MLERRTPFIRSTYAKAMKLRGEQITLYTNSDQVMIMQERSVPRETHLLKRGAYDAPGEVVTPAVLHSLNPLAERYAKKSTWSGEVVAGARKSIV